MSFPSHTNNDADENPVDMIPAGATLNYLNVANANDYDCFMWLYDRTANQVLTDGSFVTLPSAIIIIPGGTSATAAGIVVCEFPHPVRFDNGCSYVISDNTSTVHNENDFTPCLVQAFWS